MKLQYKINLAMVLAILAGVTFFFSKQQTEMLLQHHTHVLHHLGEMELLDQTLNKEIWGSAFRLYHNYDEVNQLLEQIRQLRQKVVSTEMLSTDSYHDFSRQMNYFDQQLNQKEEAILRFATINSMLKNSITHIPSLTHRFLKQFGQNDQDYLMDLTQATSKVFLASNALDADLLYGMDEILGRLEKRTFDDPGRARFNKLFLSHAKVVRQYLPKYVPIFQEILEISTDQTLHQANELFLEVSQQESEEVAHWTLLITIAFISSVVLIILFLVLLERRHAELGALHGALEQSATTDPLTGLSNRFALERTLEHEEDSALAILNIDNFKRVNDFYGNRGGDSILVDLARRLEEMLDSQEQQLFRLGSDDFGVLFSSSMVNRNAFIERLTQAVEEPHYDYDRHPIPIKVTVGVSESSPLLETAGMALKQIKHTRVRLLNYSPDMRFEARAEENLQMIHQLQQAISQDRIVPHFMPIMNNQSQKIERYECLMRMVTAEGEIIYPGQFLHVAHDGRLYGELTRIMIDKSFAMFSQQPYSFTVNLSIEDIQDAEVTEFLFSRLEQMPEIGPKLILEILESEAVGDYEVIRRFTLRAMEYRCRIAIDDFGSGYSNLQHLLELNIECLKIDGSLVRDIANNMAMEQMVNGIVALAHRMGIHSIVAEFVSSEAVMTKVTKMGIAYSQGYYVGEPRPTLIDQPDFL